MAQKTITVIGSLNADLVTTTPRVPSGGETLTATSFTTGSGGKGANQAVACARLSRSRANASPSYSDIQVRMIGAVGSDEFGPPLILGLQKDGIETSQVWEVDGQATGVAVILVEESSGENRILLNPGANYFRRPKHFASALSLGEPLPDLIILQLEISLDTVLQILRTAKEVGVDVLLNPAPAVELPQEAYSAVSHLIVNESEAAILTGRAVAEVEAEGFEWGALTQELLGRGVKNVVVTLGAKGAFFASQKQPQGCFVKAEKVEKVVDTTAAGDTFVGAYAVSVVRNGGNVGEQDVKWACRAAGKTVEKKGAQSAIPFSEEVNIKN